MSLRKSDFPVAFYLRQCAAGLIVVNHLVSHIVHAWHLAGLIDTITDERGYMLHGDLRSFLGVVTADAIPEEVDAVVRRLQAAVVDTVG